MNKVISIIVLICLIFSCSKISEPQDPNMNLGVSDPTFSIPIELLSSQGFELKNGVLRFSSMETFNQTMTILHEMRIKEIDNWVESLDGYISLLDRQTNIIDELSNETIEDPVFASVVNSDGLIIIGDSVMLIELEYEYVISKDKCSEKLIPSEIRSQGKKNTILRQSITANKLKFSGWQTQTKNYWPAENRKADLQAWNSSYAAYASFGIKLTNFQGSSRNRFDYCEISGDAEYKQNTEPDYHYASYDNTEENKKVNKIVMGWLAGVWVVWDVGYINNSEYILEERCSGVYKTFTWTIDWN